MLSGFQRCILLLAELLTIKLSNLHCHALSVTSTPFTSKNRIPILFDNSNHLHRSIQYHPEQPARIEACVAALQEYQLRNDQDKQRSIQLIDVDNSPAGTGSTKDAKKNKGTILHQPVSQQELDRARSALLQIHDSTLVTNLEAKCRNSRQRRLEEGKDALGFVGYIDDDTYVTTETFDVCLRATAVWMRAVDYICSASSSQSSLPSTSHDCQNVPPIAIALTRPPGHHATTNMSNGFCLFNFTAAAAKHYQELATTANSTTPKISILDWDVHFGQGVADIVSKDSENIRYASIHQVPAFPYMGTTRQVQHGNIYTIPIVAETTWTCGYQQKFQEALDFLFARNDGWDPDLVIVCAGYDALDSDELASVNLNAKDYGTMTQALLERVKQSSKANIGLLLGLEGGYQLGPMAGGGNLQQAVVETVKALVGSD